MGDENDYVRRNACRALGYMHEKAATNEVISKLVNALEDESDYVRREACKALGNIGEKAATNEVISKLVSALEDESDDVRSNACVAIEYIGEKAATYEVISKLVNALGDESDYVRRNACDALGKMGGKAATSEVISKLVVLVNSDGYIVPNEAANAIGKILSSYTAITQLDPKIIADLFLCEDPLVCLKNVSADQLINSFFTTKNPDWLSALSQLTLLKGAAVTATKDKIVVYGSKEPLELPVLDLKLLQKLMEALHDQGRRLHLSLEMPSEVLRNERKVASSSLCDIL